MLQLAPLRIQTDHPSQEQMIIRLSLEYAIDRSLARFLEGIKLLHTLDLVIIPRTTSPLPAEQRTASISKVRPAGNLDGVLEGWTARAAGGFDHFDLDEVLGGALGTTANVTTVLALRDCEVAVAR